MNENMVEELEQLLLETLPSVVIRSRGTRAVQLPTIDGYRQNLQRCRDVYDPSLRYSTSSFYPEVGEIRLSGLIADFVSRELIDCIRDGRIHSATDAFTRRSSNGHDIDNVVQNLLIRAIVDGPSVAARAFDDCKRNTSCSLYEFFLLSGTLIDKPMKVSDGITLIPLPNSVSDFPPYLPSMAGVPADFETIVLDQIRTKILVCVEVEVSPIFQRPGGDFLKRIKGQDSYDFDPDILCGALGLASWSSVRPVMKWTSLKDYEIFDLSGFRGIGGSGYSATLSVLRLDPSYRRIQPKPDTVSALYQALAALPTKTWDKLRVPIDRWMKSFEQQNPLDQVIDLGISLESLYVPDAEGEITLRFALRAAWHLGKDATDRKRLRDEFREIYAARSDAVHAGKWRSRRAKFSPIDAEEFVRKAQDLCRDSITSVIEADRIPEWDDLVLGGDVV